MFSLFENTQKRVNDNYEVRRLVTKYGDDEKDIVLRRSKDLNLNKRHRNHWRRIAKKIP